MTHQKDKKTYEFKSEELEVGMEVAVPYYNDFLPRHTTWAKYTISKLTPKKTKATLDGLMTVSAVKTYFGYESRLYRYEPWMDEETQHAKVDKETADILRDFQGISPRDFVMGISDDEMPVVHNHAIALKKYVEEYKERRRKRW